MLEAVEQAARMFTPITLELEDYLWVLRRAASIQASGGQVYDGLILKCAERARVEVLYTWNTAHFSRIAWPEMAGRIRSP
ncbi:MAG: hypothetical protein ACT4O1_13065 [Gemmatimonadota bacterium]